MEPTTRDTERARDFGTTVCGRSVNASAWYMQWGVDGADFGGPAAVGDRFPAGLPTHWMP